jgi:ABC-type transport system involved in multi-copper enzyme maturation permease subunit
MVAFQIARLTLQDLLRRRVLVTLALFAAGIILLSFPLRELTIGQWQRLITDVSLGASNLALVLLGVLLGGTLIAGDLDRRTLYAMLAKPISRSSFVVGKYFGLCLVLAILATGMYLGTAGMLLAAHTEGYWMPLTQGMLGILLESFVVAGVATLFSCFTSSTLAGIFALAVGLLGHFTENLAFFGRRAENPVEKALLVGIARGLPQLDSLNLKTVAAHAAALPWGDLSTRLAYAAGYATVCVGIGCLIFARRDLK